jgi:galactose mutarotase-like enzyme
MFLLKNQSFSASISPLGAELQSVQHLASNREYMWRADPQFWGRTSPILFPIVGRLTNNTTLINGQAYQLPQHGFARDEAFTCIEQRDDYALFLLKANKQSKQNYPFDFELLISYLLQDNTLTVTWQVHNTNNCTMPFSVGAHPAFSTQLQANDQFEDYDIIFDTHKQYHLWQLNEAMQLVNKNIPFQQALQQFPLTYQYFEIDALVFAHQQLNTIYLKNRHHGHGVKVDFTGFPEVALWTADGKNKRSPFLCIEPWFGHADLENGAPELVNKRGIINLAAGDVFNAQYSMTFF